MDKTSIAKKIIHFRKLKGITQEGLAEITGLNVRTIQRIESGEVDPRLYTLKSIADALGVNLEELLPEPTQHELNQLAILHITPAGFFLFPVIGNVLLPFIFWMLKREEINGINKHGKDILNGQLTYSIVISLLFLVQMGLIFLPVILPGTHLTFEVYQYFPLYIFGGMFLCAALFGIFPALNAMRVYRGKNPWKYPLKINFFK
ncbi:MAG TPA: helix-turn-helix domain-containing protein [Chryseolinea sp.]|nr:helix-turn-helix domain-containing protein [Chryseolinea sp.]